MSTVRPFKASAGTSLVGVNEGVQMMLRSTIGAPHLVRGEVHFVITNMGTMFDTICSPDNGARSMFLSSSHALRITSVEQF